VWLTFAQCMLGAQGRKYTTILASQSMARHLTHLHGLCCPGSGWHTKHVRAFGSDEFGGSRAARAAAYPPSLNRLLAGAMALAAAAQRAGRAALRMGDTFGSPRSGQTAYWPGWTTKPYRRGPPPLGQHYLHRILTAAASQGTV
jgi:hypothetical protein